MAKIENIVVNLMTSKTVAQIVDLLRVMKGAVVIEDKDAGVIEVKSPRRSVFKAIEIGPNAWLAMYDGKLISPVP